MTDHEDEIVWPLGRSVVPQIATNDAIDSLEGKKVAFVWDYLFRGREMFEVIKRVISEDSPTTSFVDHETFGNIHGGDTEEKAALASLAPRMREHGAAGAVVAVGA